MEITQSETFAKRKAHFKNMKTVQDIFGITSSIPTFTLQKSQKEERERGPEKIFEDIIAEILPNMGKEKVTQVQKAQRLLFRMRSKKNIPKHTVT